ncbi:MULTISPECIES: GNAT family N-acetyltransferase [Nocardia]|uniref:GNAT family N-acetyltransferase n=1 Tax=Nocardia TaxID=1817 RepID=UPI00191603BB|nr:MULTISPECIES: GNAT family N-acetyltransferase [Nocardia]
MSVMIRPRTGTDLDACVAALREVHDVDRYPELWPTDPVGWLSPPKLLAAVVAERDGMVIGHIGLGVSGRTPQAVRDAVGTAAVVSVIRLFVVPGARRTGVGARLLAAAVGVAESRGQRAVLTVESGSAAAIAMYERSGWLRVHSGSGGWYTANGQEARVHYYVSPSRHGSSW